MCMFGAGPTPVFWLEFLHVIRLPVCLGDGMVVFASGLGGEPVVGHANLYSKGGESCEGELDVVAAAAAAATPRRGGKMATVSGVGEH